MEYSIKDYKFLYSNHMQYRNNTVLKERTERFRSKYVFDTVGYNGRLMDALTITFCQYLNLTNITDDDSLSASFPAVCNETFVGEIRHYLTPLIESHFLFALVYCVLVGTALCVGTVGNVIIMLVSMTSRAMNRVGRDFVINLALADLCVALVSDPICILGVLKGERWFQSRWVLCEVVASMCLTACFCAFFSLTLLAFNRYVFVCKNVWYDTIFKRPVCIVMCACAWVLAFLFEFPNFVGWGDHYFDQKNQQCIWDRTASFSYTKMVAAGLIGSPLLFMGVCFMLIFYKIYRSKMDVFTLNVDDPLRMQKVWVETLRSSKTLLVVFIAFVVCWTPYAIVPALDVENAFPMELHLFITLLAHLHSSLNFIIYMFFNKTFRRTVMIMLRCRLSHQSSRSSIDTSETSPTGKSGSKFSFNLVLNQKNAYTIKSSEKERTMALRQSMINKISRTDSSRF